jgi:hypothetical protein
MVSAPVTPPRTISSARPYRLDNFAHIRCSSFSLHCDSERRTMTGSGQRTSLDPFPFSAPPANERFPGLAARLEPPVSCRFRRRPNSTYCNIVRMRRSCIQCRCAQMSIGRYNRFAGFDIVAACILSMNISWLLGMKTAFEAFQGPKLVIARPPVGRKERYRESPKAGSLRRSRT